MNLKTQKSRHNYSVDDVIIEKEDLSAPAKTEKPKKVYYESLISKVAKKANKDIETHTLSSQYSTRKPHNTSPHTSKP